MPGRGSYTPEFKRALALFSTTPQTKLIRHIYARMEDDPAYVVRNRELIVRIIEVVMSVQGLDPRRALAGTEVSLLIRKAAARIKVKTKAEHSSQVAWLHLDRLNHRQFPV